MTGVRESICKRCAYKRICADAIIDERNKYMTGCSRFEKAKPQTNADRIRAMDDDELAVWISALYTTQYHVRGVPDFWLDWLRSAAE